MMVNRFTNDTVTVETKGEGTGFIDGEGVTIKVTGSQTDAGESDNTFDYTFNEGHERQRLLGED